MLLEGSCHCGAVRFSVESHTPYPYMRCYCSICRKTAGSGGYAINLMGDADSLKVTGKRALGIYQAKMENGSVSEAQRHFCKRCGSALWLFSPSWPELVHPHASAIDTALPRAPEVVEILLDSAPDWAQPGQQVPTTQFEHYPDESIEGWHKSRGLWVD